MTGRKHEAHVRKDTVACLKKPRITDKCQGMQYCSSPHREDENQKIKKEARERTGKEGWGWGERYMTGASVMDILCTKIWVD